MSKVLSVQLRDPCDSDLAILFEQQKDSDYNNMAAFTKPDPSDWNAFHEQWTRILSDSNILKKVILFDGAVIGSICKFQMFGKTQVCYGIDKNFWGKGLTTSALEQFLHLIDERPLYAQAASDNHGSIRVLEKCGFKLIGTEIGFANARQSEIEESIFELV
jgi:RimJ/RimL family protein N-acetyltransferase